MEFDAMLWIQLLGIFVVAVAPIAVVAEWVLWLMRRKGEVSWWYVVVATLVRTIFYVPVSVGVGHGGFLAPLAVGLVLDIVAAAEVELAWGAMPIVVVFTLSVGLSCVANRKVLFGGKHSGD